VFVVAAGAAAVYYTYLYRGTRGAREKRFTEHARSVERNRADADRQESLEKYLEAEIFRDVVDFTKTYTR